ncbi:LytTR family DNA-binding domain-containing protein [Allofustis seminis]|uniref:LytTR family DNA-binding domain-containing protein n=1 Tax=Allofustis seminis TaxID=166939 RepID=UPI00036BAB0D|nr:LytTR family DNA-binding domain-containing protein [Allofustis seminis]
MDVEIKINEQLHTPLLTIETPAITQEVTKIAEYARSIHAQLIAGEADGKIEILPEQKIIRIFAEDKKVYAKTTEKTYRLKLPLYEVERRLGSSFMRISQSEIINVLQIRSLDLDFAGTICLNLTNQETVYCSRRYVKIIKAKLGL